jgi:hypothetical protein
MNPSSVIRRAIDAYRVRCWKSGLRCPCKCLNRIPWHLVKAHGYEAFQVQKRCLCNYPPPILETFSSKSKIPLEEFKTLLHKHTFALARYGISARVSLEKWGDDYLATFLQLSRYYQTNAKNTYMNTDMWIMYLQYVFSGNYPITTGILETWKFRKQIPHESVLGSVFSKQKTLANPQVRTFLETPKYNAIITSYVGKLVLSVVNTPAIRLCKGGGVAKKITAAYWSLLAFWCRVGARVRTWRTSFSLQTSIPYTPKEPLTYLILRNPTYVPNASYVFGTTIHRDAETCLQMTFYFNKHQHNLMRWTRFLADQDTANAHRAMNKLWRVCSRFNMAWYFAFANTLATSSVSHNRLLHSVLHQSLQGPAQFSLEMTRLFWNCMRTPAVRPQVIAKLLYISNLRNTWHADGHHAFSELMWTPAIQVNISHECVCKELSYYLSNWMVLELGRTALRDKMQQSLWDSKTLQRQHANLIEMYTTRKDAFLARVPALWWAKKERNQRRAAAILNSVPLRTLAIRSSYKWRKLQKTPCPICMNDGVPMVPLHMDIRHAICMECRVAVNHSKNCCPICRVPLGNTCGNQIEYGEYNYDNIYEYEDPDYDDDQWYHYD